MSDIFSLNTRHQWHSYFFIVAGHLILIQSEEIETGNALVQEKV